MRRFTIPLLLILCSVMACTKEYVVPNRTIITDLDSDNWVTTDGGRSYRTTIDMPEISNYVNENHGVLVYISLGEQTYEQVPQVYDGIAYSYFARPGEIVLEVEDSDGSSFISRPDPMTVKIILIESVQ